MQEYPNPRKHLETYIDRAARRYVDGLEQVGLQRSAKLERALATRAFEEGEIDYKRQLDATFEHNTRLIMQRHEKRMNEIKRNGARLRLWTCPLVVAIFGGMAWYSFSHPGVAGVVTGIVFTVGALAFLLMLVLGAIFDKPTKKYSSSL